MSLIPCPVAASNQPAQGTERVSSVFRYPVEDDYSVAVPYGEETGSGTFLGERIICPRDTEVHAAAAGTIRFAGYADGYGPAVIIEHYTGSEYVCTLYAHLSEGSGLPVSAGWEVAAGDVIGFTSFDMALQNEGLWPYRLHFGIRKGPYQDDWGYQAYDPPADRTEWYDPSTFTHRHGSPQDRALVRVSEGPQQGRTFWFQNGKLYGICDYLDSNPDLGPVLDAMQGLPGWAEADMVYATGHCLERYSGWPNGLASLVATDGSSNGLLLTVEGSGITYLIQGDMRIPLFSEDALEYAGCAKEDAVTVTPAVLSLFQEGIDNAMVETAPQIFTASPMQQCSFDLVMQNTGTTTWTEPLGYRLALQTDATGFANGDNFSSLPLSDNVTPGQTSCWTISDLMAPSQPGSYPIAWQMEREGAGTFGEQAAFILEVEKPNAAPSPPSQPSGPSSGSAGISYTYATSTFDADNGSLSYLFDWDDSTFTETEEIACSAPVNAAHAWQEPGIYAVKVCAQDSRGNCSEWSDPTIVTIDMPANTSPGIPALPTGPYDGYTGQDYTFSTSAIDSDGDYVKFIFYWGDASTSETGLVPSGSAAGLAHSWSKPGTYSVRAMAIDSRSSSSSWSESKYITVSAPPAAPSPPSGRQSGLTGASYTFSSLAVSESKGRLRYIFDWGDGTTSQSDFLGSGIQANLAHAWESPGIYEIKVQALDEEYIESPWSQTAVITIISLGSSDLEAPAGLLPANSSYVYGEEITFSWDPVEAATRYFLEINSESGWDIESRLHYGPVYSTSIAVEGFPNDDTEYHWRVRAGDGHHWSQWSPAQTFTNQGTLEKPELILPAEDEIISGTEITYRWKETPGATRYTLEVNSGTDWLNDGVKFLDTLDNVTEYTDTGYYNNNTTYYWRVRAGNDDTWSQWSDTGVFINAGPILVTPKDEEEVSGDEITFSWQSMGDDVWYLLEVNSDPGWDPEEQKVYAELDNITSYTDSGYPEDGTVYYWRVLSVSPGGWGAHSAVYSFTSSKLNIPDVPKLTSPDDGLTLTGEEVAFNWGAVAPAEHYLLEVNTSTDWKVEGRKFYAILDDVTSYKDEGYPRDGTSYYWRVRAGNKAGWSAPSEVYGFTSSIEQAPVLLSPADEAVVSGTRATLEWREASDVSYYMLDVNTSEGWEGSNRLYRGIVNNATSYEIGDLPNDGTVVYWRVRAGKDSTWSGWSPVRSFTSGQTGAVTAPKQTAPADGGDMSGTSVTYKWNTVKNATGYILEVNTDPVTWSRKTRKFFGQVGNAAQYTDTGYPDDGTVYYWRVRAGNDAGWSGYSETFSFTNW